MAAGLNLCIVNGTSYKVREYVWGEGELYNSEDRGGVTWDLQAMEVKGQLISVPEPLSCPNRKQRERMAELQERRQSLQTLLSMRLAELRRICLQEAELTGAVPSDFPLEAGEKPPCVRRRSVTIRQGNRKGRAEEEDSQRFKPKKTLFSAALRKHSDREHNTHTQTHTHHGKRTVHRGCHTDDTVRSESSSTSDSTGHDNDDVFQCRPPLVPAGSPVEVFYQNKRRNSMHNRTEHPEPPQIHRPLPLPPSHPLPLLLQPPPPPPPRSLDSSSSSGPSDVGVVSEQRVRVITARSSNSSEGLLDHIISPQDKGAAGHQGALGLNGAQESRGTNVTGMHRSTDTLVDGRTRTNNVLNEEVGRAAGAGRARGGGRVGGYSEVLLDYVWGKQQQLQRQQSQTSRQGVTSHHPLLYNGFTSQQPPGPPPTYAGDQRKVKVTRTKSCGPFLPVQQSSADTHNPHLPTIQPDPHPHLLPPRPTQAPPTQDAHREEATRNLHKALALEGLRDWYLRNTVGSSHTNQANGKVNTGVNTGVKGQAGGGLQRRRTTHSVIQPPTYQTEASHHAVKHPKKTALPHSATFHGHPVHGRSVDSSLCQDSHPPDKREVPLREPSVEQPSPGTLV